VVVSTPIYTNLVTNERMNQSINELLCQSSSKPLWSLGTLLFVAYVKGEEGRTLGGSTIRLLADGCLIYRDTVNSDDGRKLQIDMGRLEEWVVENGMEVNPGKSKAVSFTRARLEDLLSYSLLDQVIPEASGCK